MNVKSFQKHDFNDPFNAGQMIGMLMILTMVEENKGIDDGLLQALKWQAAENAGIFLKKPAEDVHLQVNKILEEMKI